MQTHKILNSNVHWPSSSMSVYTRKNFIFIRKEQLYVLHTFLLLERDFAHIWKYYHFLLTSAFYVFIYVVIDRKFWFMNELRVYWYCWCFSFFLLDFIYVHAMCTMNPSTTCIQNITPLFLHTQFIVQVCISIWVFYWVFVTVYIYYANTNVYTHVRKNKRKIRIYMDILFFDWKWIGKSNFR